MINPASNIPGQVTQQGWLCPKCNGAHAPTVQSCPFGAQTGSLPSPYYFLPPNPWVSS